MTERMNERTSRRTQRTGGRATVYVCRCFVTHRGARSRSMFLCRAATTATLAEAEAEPSASTETSTSTETMPLSFNDLQSHKLTNIKSITADYYLRWERVRERYRLLTLWKCNKTRAEQEYSNTV